MRRHALGVRLVMTIVLMLTAVPAFPQTAGGAPSGGAAADVEAFVSELNRACSRGDRAAVASLVHYPLSVSSSGIKIPIENRETLLKSYDAVFTPGVCQAVRAADEGLRSGKASDSAVSVSTNGVVIGGQAVEARRVGGALKVVRVSSATPSGGGAGARVNERIVPRPGTPARFRGALGEGARESYVVALQQGQLLSVRIDEVKGRDILARVVHAESGEPVDARADRGVRAWNGRVSKAGDYRIEVARTGGTGDAIGYMITVDVK